MDDVTSMSLAGSRMAIVHSLTHSKLINLFIKLELSNFLPPPLLSIVFVQESSERKISDEGRQERRTFLPEKWRAWVLGKSLSGASKIEVRHFGFMCLCFVNMLVFDYRLLLTHR